MGNLSKTKPVADQQGLQGPPCRLGLLWSRSDDDDKSAIVETLASERLHTTVAKWLTTDDLRITDQLVARHRNGTCSCDVRFPGAGHGSRKRQQSEETT